MLKFELQIPRFENPLADTASLTEEEEKISAALRDEGFCVLNFPLADFDSVAQQLVSALTEHFLTASDNNALMPGQRLQDALHVPAVREIATNSSIIALLSKIYGRKAFPFQTLNFPRGTEQSCHSDHVHFDSIPPRFMAGVWVALEDTDEENGPLFYYPGSHKWLALTNTEVSYHQAAQDAPHYPRFPESWEAFARFYSVEKKTFTAQKGDCLIWTSNLVHGGMYQKDQTRTRWSQVTHYYFDNCAYYTPLRSSPHSGRYHWRDIHDIATGDHKPNVVNGFVIDRSSSDKNRFNFDADVYLELNPDVKAAGVDPYRHYLEFGINEKRPICHTHG